MKTKLFMLTMILLALSQAEAQRLPASEDSNPPAATDPATDLMKKIVDKHIYEPGRAIPLAEIAKHNNGSLADESLEKREQRRAEYIKNLVDSSPSAEAAESAAAAAAKAAGQK